jgi:HAD superfamily hydrolase (TIGR01509 family)
MEAIFPLRQMQAVLFDLGNTLVSYYAAKDFSPILRECLKACHGVLHDEPHADEDELFQRALALNTERADYVVWPLADRLAVLFGDDIRAPAIQEQLARAFLEPIFSTALIDRDAPSVLASLRTRGLRIAIISNTPWGSPGHLWRNELDRHHLLDAVDATVFCVDVGYRKPHPAPIERALSLLGVDAADAVFVGDDPIWDMTGAERAGVRPILLARDGRITTTGFPVITSLPQLFAHLVSSSS